ncbi:mandelate racemase/muconate lactonizing enzyme family protein [Paraburkholderia sp. DHOC27]|uniref:mandelate racemase/muconate lactonizing enzyme family protein n=1 Tax=Paraburkholderia sp. DHOC27 TaxID=2303330 RepID=UPI000E3E87A9|nr:mandelate racemase/muconate lactonizing enzyme family protein [Paraburkholderia sp. DHOC27]RFU46335.1 mandelate racemase/muconate lactonizing enzyme family protein [Paraburkholderia sp. DHOC27]
MSREPQLSAHTARIARIDITHHQLELDPPFPASWDSQPRRKFPATIVRVYDDEGRMGVGSGDVMYGFADYQHLFIGTDPLDLARHSAVLDNIGFHAGRPWPLDIALWDLAGKIRGEPCWKMMGGRSQRIRAYASSGVHRHPDAMADMARHIAERGFAALKIRFGRPSLADDLAALAAVREAVGDRLELMVDCNQGWRMPWDTTEPWNVATALEVAGELEKYDVYWMEEPLHRGDYAGYAALRRGTTLRIAGGEMTRERYEFDQLLAYDSLDVFQPDVACSLGMEGLRKLAHAVEARGKVFTPHTWGNGIGLMANLHLTAGAASAPFIEFPYDPPEWSIARRDFMLQQPIDIDSEGWLTLSDAPGLGLAIDEAALAATLSSRSTYA